MIEMGMGEQQIIETVNAHSRQIFDEPPAKGPAAAVDQKACVVFLYEIDVATPEKDSSDARAGFCRIESHVFSIKGISARFVQEPMMISARTGI